MIASKENEVTEVKPKVATPTNPHSKTENVINSFGPSLGLENVFGIFRFHIKNGHLMPTTNVMKLFGLFMTIVVVIVFLVGFDVASVLSSGQPQIRYYVTEDFPPLVILIQYLSSAVMTSWLLSKANIRILNSFADLDSTLHINASKDFYRKLKNHTIIVLSLIFIIHLITSACDFILQTNEYDSVMIHILSYILNFVQDLEILIFYSMINMLTARLKVINHYLIKCIHSDSSQDKTSVYTISQRNEKIKNKFNLPGDIRVADVRVLSLAYDVIGETCRLVNSVYNFQIFMTLISAFVYIVITLWTSLYYFRTNVQTGNLVAIILWCCSEMLTVASMAFVCESLLSTRNDTKVLVNELVMDYDLPTSTRAQAKAFMELIDAWPLRIYVYDMFSVDITLMLKFISVSTTYLIVIIQISNFDDVPSQ